MRSSTPHPFWVALFSLVLLTGVVTGCGSGGGGSSPSAQTPSTPTPDPDPDPAPDPEPEPGDDIPAGGALIITDTPAADFIVWEGDFNGPVGTAQTISVEHEDFAEAVRVTVTNPAGEFFNGQVQYPSLSDVSSGDVLLAHFYFRSVENMEETGAGFATVFIEGPGPEYAKYITREVSNTGQWQEFFIPLEMTQSEQAGDLRLIFGFGAGDRPQTFDIAGVSLINYGNSVSVDDLPSTDLSYDGRARGCPLAGRGRGPH